MVRHPIISPGAALPRHPSRRSSARATTVIGQTLGSYQVVARLGEGGMGEVYRARDTRLQREVAIKVLPSAFAADADRRARFEREAQTVATLSHPNIVGIFDTGVHDGQLFVVMELLEGETLRERLATGALPVRKVIEYGVQIARGLAAAHAKGLIHRDLKPANIFIEQRPNLPAVIKVLDFGVAKFAVEEHEDDYDTLTQVGAIIGTPRYMAPEQCSGAAQLTPAADVYSLGIILYEMLTGAVPFNADTPLAIALKQVSEAPTTPHEVVSSIPAELEKVVLHALQKNPIYRPRNADELRDELHATAEELGFEHADSRHSPSLDDLRVAGTESPSGRLVIDLATLRQVQAAASQTTADSPQNLARAATVPLAPENVKPEFNRVSIPFKKPSSKRAQLVVLAIFLLIVIAGSGLLVARWWGGVGLSTSNVPANANVDASPSPTPTPSPSATPTAKPAAKPRPSPAKKEGPIKKVWNKVKGIFK